MQLKEGLFASTAGRTVGEIEKRELFLDLVEACRKGDVERVQYLVEFEEVPINVSDDFDATPLYYACLCGRTSVVKYLLDKGARCAENTFEGERCFYGALTMEIRNLLKAAKIVSGLTLLATNSYRQFLLGVQETGLYSDITFSVHGVDFTAHRAILAARCPYLSDMLGSKWAKKTMVTHNKAEIDPRAFEVLLRYLYTDRVDMPSSMAIPFVRLLRQCKLHELIGHVAEAEKQNKLQLVIEPLRGSLVFQQQMSSLHRLSLPPELRVSLEDGVIEVADVSDMEVEVDGHVFRCCKVFLCGRSEFFRTISDGFFVQHQATQRQAQGEMENQGPIKVGHIPAEIFKLVLEYIYTDQVAVLPHSMALPLLRAADYLMLPGLKTVCGTVIGQTLTTENVLGIFGVARTYDLLRLEDRAVMFMAEHLHKVIQDPSFVDLVLEEANSIKNREEIDSIPIIDEIRTYLDQLYGFADVDSEDEERVSAEPLEFTDPKLQIKQEKLLAIDRLLERLNLVA
eukprot:comp19714_c0_seq1/m.23466 comp19714_c0_seq1/g.23466  ORF comp19714_c0_seq1/g.23466 comp19714_c0_seq1/m.23466 type:complete len:512 (-) comp19714_c0_seq1:20-1555(-)